MDRSVRSTIGMREVNNVGFFADNHHITMRSTRSVKRSFAGLSNKQSMTFPRIQIIGTIQAKPVPLVGYHPIIIVEAKHLCALARHASNSLLTF